MPGYSIASDVPITGPNKYERVPPKKKNDERSWSAFFLDFFGFANDSRIEIGEAETASISLFDRAFLPKPFGILGLIYIGRLVYDVSNLFADAWDFYQKEKDKEQANEKENQNKASFFAALKLAARHDRQRISRICNDFVWSVVNIACLVANPLVSLIMTVVGVTFDVVHQAVLFARDMHHYKKLEGLNKRLLALKESHADKAQIKQLKQKIKKVKTTYNLQDEKHLVIKNRLGVLGLVLLFSVGCILTLFPPTSFVGGIMMGASAVIGLTKLLSSAWDLAAKWFGGRKKDEVTHPAKDAVDADEQKAIDMQTLTPAQRNALEAQQEMRANDGADNDDVVALSSSAQILKQTGTSAAEGMLETKVANEINMNMANVIDEAGAPEASAAFAKETAVDSSDNDVAPESVPKFAMA